jgi:hypothetical protein
MVRNIEEKQEAKDWESEYLTMISQGYSLLTDSGKYYWVRFA